MGFLFALAYIPPAIIFFGTQEEPLAWLVAYLIGAPWIVLFSMTGWRLKRSAKQRAASLADFELELSSVALQIRSGNLSSVIHSGGMRAVERLKEHIALTFENLGVALLPLSAFESTEEAQKWIEELQRLCPPAESPNKTMEPTR